MRTGIFGGTFNPVHSGHVRLAKEFVSLLNLDRMLIIPTCKPPHKSGGELVSWEQRAEMCRLAFSEDIFEVSDIELRRGGKSYTFDTLTELHSFYPEDEFFFIMGTDMLLSFHTWYKPQEILKLCTPCVAVRDNVHPLSELREYIDSHEGMEHTVLSRMESFPVSSTQLRQILSKRGDTGSLLPPDVLRYIIKEGLYTDENK